MLIVQRMLATLALPVPMDTQQITASASLGISVYPRDGEKADILLRNADTAMYRAKDQGDNTMAFFTPEMNDAVISRLRTEAGLRRALERGELRG